MNRKPASGSTSPSCAPAPAGARRALLAACVALPLASLFVPPAAAQTGAAGIALAAGAGYKKPLVKIIELYRAQTGQKVAASFGHMQQIAAQAQASGAIAILVGDEKVLQGWRFVSDLQPLGEGRMVIAWRKGLAPIGQDADLLAPEVGRIALPDPVNAVFGVAATEWIKGKGWTEKLQGRLLAASTVPQVSSYLVTGEVDAGFINLTDAIDLGERIGGYRILAGGYTPVRIVAGVVAGHEADAQARAFLQFLLSAPAAAVFREFGM